MKKQKNNNNNNNTENMKRSSELFVSLLVLLSCLPNSCGRGHHISSVDYTVMKTCKIATKNIESDTTQSGTEEDDNDNYNCNDNYQQYVDRLDRLIEDLKNMTITGQSAGGDVVPAFQLYNCAVMSLAKLKRTARKYNIKGFRSFLGKLCQLHKYDRDCIRKPEAVKLRGYLRVPSCQEILEKLEQQQQPASCSSSADDDLTLRQKAERLKNTTADPVYRTFVKSILYDELARAQSFLGRYRLKVKV